MVALDHSCWPYLTTHTVYKLTVPNELQVIFIARNSTGVSLPNELCGRRWLSPAAWAQPYYRHRTGKNTFDLNTHPAAFR